MCQSGSVAIEVVRKEFKMPIGSLLLQKVVLTTFRVISCVLCYEIGESQIKSKGPDSEFCGDPLLVPG